MQKRRTDLTGMRFGRLEVIKFDHYLYRKKPNGYEYRVKTWLCKCDCGTFKVVGHSELTSGNTKSCGCYMREHQHAFIKQYTKPLKHPRIHRLHEIWIGMKERCNNPQNNAYEYYGKRGIKVCDEWNNIQTGYDTFFEWAISNGYSDKLSIDRIDVNGNYEPKNCRWADNYTQSLNKRNTLYLTYKGEKKPLMEWAKEYKIPYSRLKFRIQNGWDVEKALITPKIDVKTASKLNGRKNADLINNLTGKGERK